MSIIGLKYEKSSSLYLKLWKGKTFAVGKRSNPLIDFSESGIIKIKSLYPAEEVCVEDKPVQAVVSIDAPTVIGAMRLLSRATGDGGQPFMYGNFQLHKTFTKPLRIVV